MTARRRVRKPQSVAVKSIELAAAVPRVVAHRVTRAVLAGPQLSERDRREFRRMVDEKQVAFMQSWGGMALQLWRVNHALTASALRLLSSPLGGPGPSAARLAAQLQREAIGVLDKGLTPVHRKAVANARRLAKTKLR